MKKIQKELAGRTVEASSQGVTVVARCDMSIADIKIDQSEIDSSNVERLEKMLVSALNKALDSAKKQAGSEMSKMAGGLGGLTDMLGM